MRKRTNAAGAALAAVVLLAAAPLAHGARVVVQLVQIDRLHNDGRQGTIDLSKGGTAVDWIKPIGTNLTAARKASTSLLTIAQRNTTNALGTYGDDGYTFTWAGGEAGNPSGSSIQGTNMTSLPQNAGFRTTFTAPAAGDYVLEWYSAANNTQNWRLTGTIGSSTDFEQSLPNVGTTSGNGGVDDLFWSASFNADSAGQQLVLDLVNTTTTGSVLAITGVTVAAVPEPATIGLVGVAAAGLLGRRRRTT